MKASDLILEMIASYKPDATTTVVDHENQTVTNKVTVAENLGKAISESLTLVLTPSNKSRAHDFAFIFHHVFYGIEKLQGTKSFNITHSWAKQVEQLDVMANCVPEDKVAQLADSIASTVPDLPFVGFSGHEKVIMALESAIRSGNSKTKEKTL